MIPTRLTDYLDASSIEHASRVAVTNPDGAAITYAELSTQSSAVANLLTACGVAKGDRVGIVMPKGAAAVASVFGIMKAGAAYVPVDYSMPVDRARRIFADCRITALIVGTACATFIDAAKGIPEMAAVIHASESNPSTWTIDRTSPREPVDARVADVLSENDLAYVLYTSGSTGTPKGVMITHRNAVSFVEWSSTVFAPSPDDRFSSHAPFHFDLSIFDLYVCFKHGASLHVISEELGKNPKELAKFIAARRLSVWYSTPSILTLLMQFGNLENTDLSTLRLVLFAGEVFPVKHLRRLKRIVPHPDYYNLYGPTETNVCTFARIPDAIPEDRTLPYPIGFPCSNCDALVLTNEGEEAAAGEEGLLFISGPTVFSGYWNQSPEKSGQFVTRNGLRWYNTGDIVKWDPDGGFMYVGRNDRMVKRRGYRIELGEIERALYTHPHAREVAVVASSTDGGVEITAFLSCDEGTAPSIIDLKTFCKATLPAYMSPDRFIFMPQLPKTATDKTDYQSLKASLPPAGVLAI
jgi:amino acid adenylation domain-containing protein